MSGLKLEQLSANWKKLQEKLQADKKKQKPAQSNGVKRKRTEDEQRTTNGYKKPRISRAQPKKQSKTGKMGLSTPKPDESEHANKHSSLTTTHDIAPSDISAAYGPFKSYNDQVNCGLHPTNKPGKYLALDCEMVGTGPPPHLEHLLARASLVNFHGDLIYDSYVLPPPNAKVEDYRTFVSGIKPSHLAPNYARSYSEVQKDVAKLLEGRVLVGHALKNDLQVLGFGHPRRDMRDTSRYAKFRELSGGRPPALRLLAEKELGVRIQVGEHSSVEDARATMGLFKKEKVGFEEECRRKFGVRKVLPKKDHQSKVGNGAVEDRESEDEDENDEELDLLDGEGEEGLDEDDDTPVRRASATTAKKKRKKKKRTKRK
jgi:RNA exonuclease 4